MSSIVFMGTPEFAVPSLETLIENFDVKAVFTQPDRPRGRGKKIRFSPVKEVAVKNDIKVFQPVSLKKENNFIEEIKKIEPDFIVVVAFGQILSKEILDIPKYACINLHASLLPKYRGAAPINWAIINGEEKSGITTMLMDVGLDTGDILLKEEVEITDNMTAGELHDKLMYSGGDLLVKTIEAIQDNKIKSIKQDEQKSSYAPMLNKKMGKINWNMESHKIINLIRGLNPWPVAYSYFGDKIMKIYKAKELKEKTKFEPGYIIEVSKDGLKVSTGDGCVLIDTIQFPGGKPLTVDEYIRGNKINTGIVLK